MDSTGTGTMLVHFSLLAVKGQSLEGHSVSVNMTNQGLVFAIDLLPYNHIVQSAAHFE